MTTNHELVLPTHFSKDLVSKCHMLSNDITKMVYRHDSTNESFEKSYRLCYDVAVRDGNIVKVILSHAIECAAMQLLPREKNLGSPTKCRTYFDSRVDNLHDTMSYWSNTLWVSRNLIGNDRSWSVGSEIIVLIADKSWRRALERVTNTRQLMLSLMSSGLCVNMAFKIIRLLG